LGREKKAESHSALGEILGVILVVCSMGTSLDKGELFIRSGGGFLGSQFGSGINWRRRTIGMSSSIGVVPSKLVEAADEGLVRKPVSKRVCWVDHWDSLRGT
jgi:hypothetical protein